jgi:hypothetical protein
MWQSLKRHPAGGRKRPSSVTEPRMAEAFRIGGFTPHVLAGHSS